VIFEANIEKFKHIDKFFLFTMNLIKKRLFCMGPDLGAVVFAASPFLKEDSEEFAVQKSRADCG